MYNFMFIVVLLLLFLSSFCPTAAATNDYDDKRFCNASDPIFSEVTEEIHAMLARDRYINFNGWNTTDTDEYHGVKPQKIPYGYIKEMILHLSSVPETDGLIDARVFFTSNGTKLFRENVFNNCKRSPHVSFTPYCPLREQFIKFKFFKYGVKIAHVYISKNGTQNPIKSDEFSTECMEYMKPESNAADEHVNRILSFERTEYSDIDGLLIEINCNTTDVKKILVKCAPFPNESNSSG